jgi:hypothetical protein
MFVGAMIQMQVAQVELLLEDVVVAVVTVNCKTPRQAIDAIFAKLSHI